MNRNNEKKEKRFNPALIQHLNRQYRTEDPEDRRKRAYEGVNKAFAEFV